MSDESSDNDLAWWMPPDRPDPAEHEDIIELGQVDPTRPIGPMSLRSPSRRPYILAGVAVAALLGGAGAALAATNSGTPTATPSAVTSSPLPSASPGKLGTRGTFHHFGRRFGPLGLGGSSMVHGQFVVAKSGGGYENVDVQDGDVTAVSTTSITLKSSDGFTQTYVVTGSTTVDAQRGGIGSVKVGNQALLMATVSGSTATATSIADMTLLQQNRPNFGAGQGSGAGGAQPG
jgi:hypothetical protein